MGEQKRNIVPMYAARLTDLVHAPQVIARCQCGHESVVSVESLWKRLPMWTKVIDLHRRLRCAACDAKGRAEVDARRALGYDRLE